MALQLFSYDIYNIRLISRSERTTIFEMLTQSTILCVRSNNDISNVEIVKHNTFNSNTSCVVQLIIQRALISHLNCSYFSGNYLNQKPFVKGSACTGCDSVVSVGYTCNDGLCGK